MMFGLGREILGGWNKTLSLEISSLDWHIPPQRRMGRV